LELNRLNIEPQFCPLGRDGPIPFMIARSAAGCIEMALLRGAMASVSKFAGVRPDGALTLR